MGGISVKTYSKLVPTAVAVVLLAGCAQDDSKFDPEKVRADVKSTFAAYQAKSADSVEVVGDGLDGLTEEVENSLQDGELEIYQNSETVSERFESLSPETQKKLADLFTDYNPVSEFYSYDGMDDSERATLAATTLVITVATDENDVKAAKDIDESLITVTDARHAVIGYDDPDSNASGTSRDVFMVKIGDEWKIDGARTYEDFVNPETDGY